MLSRNVRCTLLSLETWVGIAAIFFAQSVPFHGYRKQRGTQVYDSSFSTEETSSEKSNHLPKVQKPWLSSDYLLGSTEMLRRDQRTTDSLQGWGPFIWEKPEATHTQPASNPPWLPKPFNPAGTGIDKLEHLVPGNHNWNHPQKVLSLLPGLPEAKEIRKEGSFDKEALTPGDLEQGFMNEDKEAGLGRHRDTS